MKKRGILLIGHGSRLEHYTRFITETANLMQEKNHDYIIQTCFIESKAPSISEGLSCLKKEDVDVIVAVPLFLSNGVHVRENIPYQLGLNPNTKITTISLNNGRRIPLVYAEPIGSDPFLAEILLKNAEKALKKVNW